MHMIIKKCLTHLITGKVLKKFLCDRNLAYSLSKALWRNSLDETSKEGFNLQYDSKCCH
jgi:hypothetical protein